MAWCFGHDTDRASVSVLAIEGPLGSLQNFDPFNIGKISHAQSGAPKKHAIHKQTHRWLKSRVSLGGADPPYAHARVKGGEVGIDSERGRQNGNIIGTVDTRLFNRRTAERGDGYWQLLQVFSTFGGGHDNLF